MKTTIEIPDSLLNEARKLASREGSTIRALVEEGLREVLVKRKAGGAFRLRRVTFKGAGLQSGLPDAAWEHVRDMAYEGRGA